MSWSAMLKKTGVKLEIIKDYEMVLMLEHGIRGGLCQVVHRYAEANNKHMLDKYNVNLESEYITYLDANNLYGWAMSFYLPYGDFKWTEWKSEDVDEILNISATASTGYIFEVDIEYPDQLHVPHDQLPFLPESISPQPVSKIKKLIPHLGNRHRYVVHYRYLQQAMLKGLKIKKIHRAIQFSQSAWLQQYIQFNTDLRTASTNEFEKDQYKLYNNAVFGKTMENIRNRAHIELVSDWKRAKKLIARPNFLHSQIYAENLVSIQLSKTRLVFNKPIYVGLTILDQSKILMYDFHYNIMLPKFGPDRLQLLYMDTDSFIYKIKSDDLIVDFGGELAEYMDTSDYPQDHPNYSTQNKKVLGKFKDEVNGKVITRFVGLRPKMYAVDIGGVVKKRAKGVQRAVLKQQITIDDYISALTADKAQINTMNAIRSQVHVLTTVQLRKVSLNKSDDKRIILHDGIRTKAHVFFS